MNMISHKLAHEPMHTYMVNGYHPDKPNEAVYIRPIECGVLDDDGSRIEEYVFGTSGLTREMYVGRKPATRCFAVYNLEYETEGARNLMLSINSPDIELFDGSVRWMFENCFETINAMNVGETKVYQQIGSYGKVHIKVNIERIG